MFSSSCKMEFDNSYLFAHITIDGFPVVRIQGTIKEPSRFMKVEVVAANPPMSMTNYSGSGLPYPCADHAFENTPNHQIIDGPTFDVQFEYPNSYYVDGATTKVAPSVFFGFTTHSSTAPTFVRLDLPDPLPLRTLTHRPTRKGPEFYSRKAEIIGVPSSQEALLRMIGDVKEMHGVA